MRCRGWCKVGKKKRGVKKKVAEKIRKKYNGGRGQNEVDKEVNGTEIDEKEDGKNKYKKRKKGEGGRREKKDDGKIENEENRRRIREVRREISRAVRNQ